MSDRALTLRRLVAIGLLIVAGSTAAWGQSYVSANATAWSTATTWTPNGVPGSGDTVVINHNITLTGPQSVDGIYFINNVSLSGAFTLTLGGGATIAVGTGVTGSITTTVIAGSAGLTKTGGGTLVLSAANTYSGTTLLSAGTLRISGASGAIASSTQITVEYGATLDIDNTSTSTDRFADTGTLTMRGGTFSWTTNAARSETIATLAFTAKHSVIAFNAVTGSPVLTASNALSRANSATMEFQRGASPFGFLKATGTTAAVTRWTSVYDGNYYIVGTYDATNGLIQTAGNVFVCNQAASTNFNWQTPATWTTNPTGTYPGAADIAVIKNNGFVIFMTAAGASVNNSVKSIFYDSGTSGTNGGMTLFNGGNVFFRSTSWPMASSQMHDFGSAEGVFIVTGTKQFQFYNAVVANTTTLTKSGPGGMLLGNPGSGSAPAWTNPFVIAQGVVTLNQATSPLGAIGGNTTVADGAGLDVAGITSSTAEPLVLNGSGMSGSGALQDSSTTACSWSGTVALASDSSIDVSSGGSLDLGATAVVSGGFALTKTGYGTLKLSAANTFSGPTTIANGTLKLSGGSALADAMAVTIMDSVWVDDALPTAAASTVTSDSWTWVSSNPTPYSGSLAHQSDAVGGIHQHYFEYATQTMAVPSGGTLVQYVWVDPANPPREIMLQWNATDGTGWEHRAYWGENLIAWGTDATVARKSMGALPAMGEWVRLEVTASLVGLDGLSVQGAAYTLYDGRATWDATAAGYTGATLDVNGTSETIGSLSGAGTTALGAGTLTAGDATSKAYAGVITGTGAVVKAGSGMWTLSGASTYSGGTTLNAGTLGLGRTSGTTLDSGLIAWYRLDEASGSTAFDSSGNGRNGAYVNTPTPTSVKPTLAFTNAQALDLSGVPTTDEDYVRLPAVSPLNTVQGSGDYSLSAWYRPTAGNGLTHAIVAKDGWNIGLMWGGGQFANELWLNDGNGTPVSATYGGIWSGGSYPTGSWYHVAGVVDSAGGTNKLYVNGSLVGTTPIGAGRTAHAFYNSVSVPWKIGSASGYLACGTVDDVRIYSRTLSQAEITSLAAGGNAGAASTLSAGPIGIGTLTINAGALQASGAARSIANPVTVAGDFTVSGTYGLTLAGATTLTGTRTITTTGTGLTTIAGVIGQSSGGLGLTKAGTGTLQLTATNTYTGATTVSAGILRVDGAQSGSAVSLSGGTLSGVGTVGTITSAAVANSNIAPGAAAVRGILRAGTTNLSLGTSPTVTIRMTTAPFATPGVDYDRLDLASAGGTLTLGGSSRLVVDLAGVTGNGTATDVITCSGLPSGIFASVTTINAPAGVVAYAVYSSTGVSITTCTGTAWSNGAGTNVWGTAGNWSGGLPDATHLALFNTTSTAPCTIDPATVNTLGVVIAAGYTGTITQASGKTVYLGASGYSQVAGTWNCSDTLYTSSFNQTGGSFSGGTVSVASSTGGNLCAVSTLTNLILEGSGEYGLVGYWKMDGTGTSEADVSGRGHTATGVNSPASSSSRPTLVFNDPASRTCDINAPRKYFTVAGHSDFSLTGPLTVACWCHVVDTGSQNDLVRYSSDFSSNGFRLSIGTGPSFGPYFVLYGGSSTQVGAPSVTVSPATWTHLCGVYDGANVWLYKNGAQFGGTARAVGMTAPATTTVMDIGGSGDANTSAGELDDVRIYNRGLSPAEVLDLYNGLYAPGSGGPVTWTLTNPLTLAGDLTVVSGKLDVSGSNHALTVAGSLKLYGGFNPRAGTVTLNGTLAKTLHTGGNRLWNLSLTNTGTWTLDDPLWVDTTLSIANGTLNVSASNHLVHAGTILQSTGTITPQAGTIVINGAANATLTVTSTLKHLQIADPAEAGLAAYWPLDEGTGATAREEVARDDGALTAGASWTTTVPSSPGPVTLDPAAAYFDGIDDCIIAPNTAALNPTTVTVSAWIRPATIAGNDHDIVSKWSNTGGSYNLKLVGGTGELTADVSTTASADTWTSGGATLSANTWYHVAMTYDGATVTSYVNGVLNTSSPVTGNLLSSPTDLYIGRIPAAFAPNRCFNGLIDDVRIYSTALSPAQIAALAAGCHATAGGSTHTLGAPLTVGGDLSLIGGTLAASTFAINLAGDWKNRFDASAFSPGSGTVTLNGTAQQLFGSTTFNTFTKSVASATTLTFPIGECQTFTGALTLNGASGQLLSIASSTAGFQASIRPVGTRACSWLSVRDSRNLQLPIIAPTNSTNAGNTRCWFGLGPIGNGVIVGAPGVE